MEIIQKQDITVNQNEVTQKSLIQYREKRARLALYDEDLWTDKSFEIIDLETGEIDSVYNVEDEDEEDEQTGNQTEEQEREVDNQQNDDYSHSIEMSSDSSAHEELTEAYTKCSFHSLTRHSAKGRNEIEGSL